MTEESKEVRPGVEREAETTSEPGAQNEELSPKEMKKLITELRREAGKYRNAAKNGTEEKIFLEKQFNEIKSELDSVKKQSLQQKLIQKLDKAGCLKSSLVLNEIPENCENQDEFIEKYKKEYPFLFKSDIVKHGYSFRGGRAANYTPSQQMNNYIRSALGR